MPTTTVLQPASREECRFVRPASRGSRFTAVILDLVMVVIFYLVSRIATTPAIFTTGLAALSLYQIYLLSTQGQTIGKQFCNIRIVNVDTHEPGGFIVNVLKRLVLNGLLCLIPGYILADVLFIFRENHRCLHDLIAQTWVIEV